MILSQGSSVLSTYKSLFKKLYEDDSFISCNPKHWKETVACITIPHIEVLKNEDVILENRCIKYKVDIHEIIPELNPIIVHNEINYFKNKFFCTDIIEKISSALSSDIYSKRLYYNFWLPEFMNQNTECICIVSCYFRIVEDKYLEMHVHSRANNAYSLLLLDMQFMIGFQKYLSSVNNMLPGDYYHFFDSLHFFRKDKIAINKQYKYINTLKLN